MSREIRRVPLDFDWPTNKVWEGYLRPGDLDLPPCPDCIDETGGRDGLTREARAVAQTFYSHQVSWTDRATGDRLCWSDKLGQAEVDHLIAEGRLRTWNRQTQEWESKPRTAAEVNAQQRRGGLGGHDAINRWILIQFRCERLGIPHYCATCNGDQHVGTPEQVAANEAWERTDPPTGEGWQVWETVSEGSPISPVFADRESLIHWLTTDYRWGAQRTPLTQEQAEAFVGLGHSIGSGVIMGNGRMLSGEAAVAELRP